MIRIALAILAFASCSFAATFGSVVPLVGGASDLVLDESRGRIYLVNTSQSRIEVYSIAQRRFLTPVRTDATPLSAAISRNNKVLYVASYDGSSLNTIDLETLTILSRVSLPVRPEGIAVGGDERVLISTIGSGAGNSQNVLLIYDPNALASGSVSAVAIAPPAPQLPQLPPASGRIFLASRSQLIASADGRTIVGVNLPNNNERAVFVYEVASGTVLRSRRVNNVSSVLSISPDGSRFMAGLSLFDSGTLEILAQQNTANSPYPFANGTNFNVQTNQGGSVFSPDGAQIYSAFDIAPVQNPPARANISQLMINDPENLLIKLGVQLPENLAGRMIISSDGAAIYALSESGFVVLPLSTLTQNPIATVDTNVVLLANDQCGVTAANRTATVNIRNDGRGRFNVNAQVLTTTPIGGFGLGGFGGAGGGAIGGAIIIILPGGPQGGFAQAAAIASPAPLVRTTNTPSSGSQLDFAFTGVPSARVPGTVSPTHTFLIQSNEAINIPPAVRVFQNFRDSDAKAELIPVPVGLSANEALVDMVIDSPRQRLYIANSGLNRVEVFDTRRKQLLTPIKVGQLPRSLALSPDGNTLYVANSGGESISVVDAESMQVVDRIHFPPLPFNQNTPLITPSIIAAGLRGPQIVMSNGTIWKVVGNTAVPRSVSPAIGTSILPAPRTMAASPNGEYIVVLAGNGFVYLYDSLADEFVQGRQVFTNPIQGFFGPVSAGPRGQYYLANGVILNQSLTPTGTAGTVLLPGPVRPGVTPPTTARPVSAVSQATGSTFVRFSQPVRANAAAALTSTDVPTVELVDANTGQTLRTAATLEGPISTAVGNQRVNLDGRTMAVDAAGTTVYALTTSGLSITTLDAPNFASRPLPAPNGTVAISSYLPAIAPGSLISIFGQNLAADGVFSSTPLPTILGGTCVTLNNQPLPLLMSSTGQINAQIPPEIAAGRYALVVRALDKKSASIIQNINVGKYAPAVFADPTSKMAAVYHQNGQPVTTDDPAKRDEPLVLYASGLGPTKGGKVTSGVPSPSDPLAVTDAVNLFFGDPRIKEAGIIVDWSGLAPGLIGVYQVNLRVPGDHLRGDALPVTLRIGGIDSQKTGPAVPVIAVD